MSKTLQEIANQLAIQCIYALGAMYGPHEEEMEAEAVEVEEVETYENMDERIRETLHLLLTPYVCAKLSSPDTHEVIDIQNITYTTYFLILTCQLQSLYRPSLVRSQITLPIPFFNRS